jgi:hypothetical protein
MTRRGTWLALASLALTGCGWFSPKPALPKAIGLTNSEGEENDEASRAVRRADIIYFPVETLAAEGEAQIWKILERLRAGGHVFALGWQDIAQDQQDMLDILAKPGSGQNTEQSIYWNQPRPIREASHQILRATSGLRHLALGAPQAIRARLEKGAALTADEGVLVPKGYQLPANGFDDFAEQLMSRHLSESEVARLYRAHLFGQEFAAERIVTFLSAERGAKLLVFARRRDLAGASGLPQLVRQKLKVAQTIFDLDRDERGRPLLLTSVRFEIINSAPRTPGDLEGAFLPGPAAGGIVDRFLTPPE